MSSSEEEMTLVEQALKNLATEGRVTVQTGADGQVRYSGAEAGGHDGDST